MHGAAGCDFVVFVHRASPAGGTRCGARAFRVRQHGVHLEKQGMMNIHAVIHARREKSGYYVAFPHFRNFLHKNAGDITHVEKGVEIV